MKKNSKGAELLYGAIWALLTAIIAFILLFLLGYGLTAIKAISVDTAEIMAYIIYILFIGISCYFICRKYPTSIFIVPVIANIMGIISSIVEPNFWVSAMWVLIVGGWVFSIITSIAGYIVKSRKQ
jgi:hypothetical protein